MISAIVQFILHIVEKIIKLLWSDLVEIMSFRFVQLVDLKAALFRKQQEYKKEKSSSVHVESSPTSSTVAAAQTAVEKAGRKVSDKVSARCPEVCTVCSRPVVIHTNYQLELA